MSKSVDEVIKRLQRLIVETLDLEMQPGDLDPDLDFAELEVVPQLGDTLGLDSVDFIEVVMVVEDRLEEKFADEDVFQTETPKRIRDMADFLVSRFGADRLGALSEPGD